MVGHLLGGLATLALLASLGRWRHTRLAASSRALRALGVVAAAALVRADCPRRLDERELRRARLPRLPDLPDTQWWPAIADFKDGFVLWRGLGIDYEGGVLDHPARVAVHFTHRLGAVVAALLIAALGGGRDPRTAARALDGLAVLAALASAAVARC